VVIAVTSKLPVNNLKDSSRWRRRSRVAQYATAGVGSFQHLASELFKQQAGLDIVHVPFKGGGPAMMDVIAGNTQIAGRIVVQMLPQIKGGKLKALGVGSAKRIAALPDVPTISEAGVPGYEVTNWWGIAAPAGTPRPVIEKLHRELAAVVASSETQKRFEAEGADPLQMSPRNSALHRAGNREVVEGGVKESRDPAGIASHPRRRQRRVVIPGRRQRRQRSGIHRGPPARPWIPAHCSRCERRMTFSRGATAG
jgi:hypothetical protein